MSGSRIDRQSIHRELEGSTRRLRLGSCGGALVFRGPRLAAKLDRTIASLHRHLDGETDAALRRTMHFPVGWDPYFKDRMSLEDVYHYGTEHFAFHSRQLTLSRST